MASFSFTSPDGKAFDIKGPPGFTFEQAKAVFDKQLSTGSLVGFKPGDVLSAASQAANGLASAQATLGQALSGINNAAGTALGGGALGGSLASTAAGLTGTVGQAVSSIGKAGSAIANAAVNTTSIAINSVKNINSSLNSPVTNPIDNADFIKTSTDGGALSRIASMGESAVTGVLAQGKKLVGQASNALSNSKGAGSFGFDAKQLETAGFLKPGTSNLIDTGAKTLSAVLKAPSAWTGKDGVKGIDGILSNPLKQSTIQQDLMAKGVSGLNALGVPVNNLSAQGVGGLALSAAKSLPNTEAFVKGLPLPAGIKASITNGIRDASFAVNLVANKMPAAFKETDVPVPSANTVNRETLNAASTRIAGNDKIPAPNYGPPSPPPANDAQINSLISELIVLRETFLASMKTLDSKVTELENQQSITQQQWQALEAERNAARETYNNTAVPLGAQLVEFQGANVLPATRDLVKLYTKDTNAAIEYVSALKSRIKLLASKIEGPSTA